MPVGHIPYKRLNRRLRRSLYYGQQGRLNQLSVPLTDSVERFFNERVPFDTLDKDFAHNISREGCVHPCTLIVALIYLDRLRMSDKNYFDSASANDMYMISLLLASKFAEDEGNHDYVYNNEWAHSAGVSLSHVNGNELEFLGKLNWNLLVDEPEFSKRLKILEADVARSAICDRGFATYADLTSVFLCPDIDCLTKTVIRPLFVFLLSSFAIYFSLLVGLYSACLCLQEPTTAVETLTGGRLTLTKLPPPPYLDGNPTDQNHAYHQQNTSSDSYTYIHDPHSRTDGTEYKISTYFRNTSASNEHTKNLKPCIIRGKYLKPRGRQRNLKSKTLREFCFVRISY